MAELGLQCPVSQLSARFTAPGLSAVSFLNAFRSHRRRNGGGGGGGYRGTVPRWIGKGGANSEVSPTLNEVLLLSFFFTFEAEHKKVCFCPLRVDELAQ